VEISEKKATVTVNYRVFTTNNKNGESLECDENGVLYSQNTDFSGYFEDKEALQVLKEINRKYPHYEEGDDIKEFGHKFKNKNWIEKQTYIVLFDDDGDEEDNISIIEALK
jgi:hypothetical protein